MDSDKLAKNIERLRREHNYTQEYVAGALNLSRTTYIAIENNKRDLTTSDLNKLAFLYKITVPELFNTSQNIEKFEQMYFYILKYFNDRGKGVPKTKLAKLLYLADFRNFFEELQPMSGVRYVHRQYGPLADDFLSLTDELYDAGKIRITELSGGAFLIKPAIYNPNFNKLSDGEKKKINEICEAWEERQTQEIVNYTHEQKPWSSCRDGEYIPYELIIQEDPGHVYLPVA